MQSQRPRKSFESRSRRRSTVKKSQNIAQNKQIQEDSVPDKVYKCYYTEDHPKKTHKNWLEGTFTFKHKDSKVNII